MIIDVLIPVYKHRGLLYNPPTLVVPVSRSLWFLNHETLNRMTRWPSF